MGEERMSVQRTLSQAESINVGLMRRISSRLANQRPIEGNSDKTVEFSARKSGVGKRLGISDEAACGIKRVESRGGAVV